VTLRRGVERSAGRAETAIFSLTDAWGDAMSPGALVRPRRSWSARTARTARLMRMIGRDGQPRRARARVLPAVAPTRAFDPGTLRADKMHPYVAEKERACRELLGRGVGLRDRSAVGARRGVEGRLALPVIYELARALIE